MHRMRRPSCLLALALVFLIGFSGCSSDQSPPADAASRQAEAPAADAPALRKAPDFALKTLDDNTFRLSDELGNVVIVNFWATWCGPCIEETPDLIALHDALKDRGFTVVGVSEDLEGFDVVSPFAEEYGVTYPMVVDDGSVAEAFGGVYGLPTTFVIDREGYIVARFYGLFPFEDMRPHLEEMLASGNAG
jgi:peroxiredoxin